ncbi:uncharacterized protein EV422DRAFT_557828 [Fimicolochytrium jonesii]|uniref:uncharacterized protein n=1 Tax=Fimicolochytrium jonesii TaxID=1396493 RepID=UPI0022FF0EA5|nr:uncharacterized protein EV422DRAFT_557828 [Fimicolochytrium jonesii]KAI8820078.1 hypothetical protein EV422DRAFT_557828 [Fimicolochytrium jonesii]
MSPVLQERREGTGATENSEGLGSRKRTLHRRQNGQNAPNGQNGQTGQDIPISFDGFLPPSMGKVSAAAFTDDDEGNNITTVINSARHNQTEMLALTSEMTPQNKADSLNLAFAVIATNVKLAPAIDFPSIPCEYLQANWTCTPGYFCQSPADNGNATSPPKAENKCPPGFLCPRNTYEPVYCCKGFYCPTPAEVHICPEGQWCGLGSVQPEDCSLLAYCPEGSSTVRRYGILALLLVVVIIVSFFFCVRRRVVKKRTGKYTARLNGRAAAAKRGPTRKKAQHAAGTGKEKLLGADSPISNSNSDDTLLLSDDDDTGVALPSRHATTLHKSFDIKFENLSLTLPTGTTIMRNVTGHLRPGRVCAVMGPSGAGKTTFVSLLTNKAPRTAGKVFINDVEEDLSRYQKLIGFVPQEDVMLRELTVFDILMHSALMRLPKEWDKARKKELVLETIAFLGLGQVMNSVVGDEVERGISGGQRKRVNIGMELVAAPSVLFLDEPTSGLDSATSHEVSTLLHRIARTQNMTIAAVIHSPTPLAFTQFDDLLLLGKGGRIIYFGPRDAAPAYFHNLGFTKRSAMEGDADFFMDVATGRVECKHAKHFEPTMLFRAWELYVAGEDPIEGLHATTALRPSKTMIGRIAKRSLMVAEVVEMFAGVGAYWKDVGREFWGGLKTLVGVGDGVRRTPGFLAAFWLCYLRACTQLYRSRSIFWFDQFIHLLCGTFIGIAAQENTYLGLYPAAVCTRSSPLLSSGPGCSKPIDTLSNGGMFIALGVLFAGVTCGAATFGRERTVFWRDVSSGMPAVPYFLAKWAADLPRILVAGVMFTATLVLLLPVRQGIASVFVVVLALYFAAFPMGYFLSTLLPTSTVPLASTGFVLLWSLILGGVTPSLPSITTYPQALQYLWTLSAPRWAVEAYYIKEAAARPWAELQDLTTELRHGYARENWGRAVGWVVAIGAGWAVMALAGLKLGWRGKQK